MKWVEDLTLFILIQKDQLLICEGRKWTKLGENLYAMKSKAIITFDYFNFVLCPFIYNLTQLFYIICRIKNDLFTKENKKGLFY